MNEPVGSLPPEIEALLETERLRPGLPDAVRVRTMSRLAETLATVGGTGLTGDGGGAADAAVSAGTTVASPALVSPATVKIFIAFVLGTGAGAGGHAWLGRGSDAQVGPAAVTSTVAAIPDVPAHSIEPHPVEPLPQPPVDKQRGPRLPPTRAAVESAPTGKDADLARERALIEVARTALSRRQSAAALAALARHSREFPVGQLREERESLWVQALVVADDYPRARARAERFRHQFPRSIFAPAVEQALRSIP